MLIGGTSKSPNLGTIRRIKELLHEVLGLSEDATITVAELACLEEDCAPVETVFGLLRPNAPQLQHKIHKPTDGIDAQDLMEVCATWGFDVPPAALRAFSKEN
jgi:hypothetical protein